MRATLEKLLEQGLNRKLETLQVAVDNPLSFRKWVRDTNPNINDRLKSSYVPYRDGLLVSLDERMNSMLDAGFVPKNIRLKELAFKSFGRRTDDLKEKLNITVSKSTYAFMVPGFAWVLNEGEVYIEFSTFVDEATGQSGVVLSDGDEFLLASSPAHFVSDIQEVRVVPKDRFHGKKDVIIFSTKGKIVSAAEDPICKKVSSLAAKLSGGDYDGAIAWICWEPSIVNNFDSVHVEEPYDLIKQGFVRKDNTTYDQLVKDSSDTTYLDLKGSFNLNMQQSLLGSCTLFKEDVCYHQKNADTKESQILSALLSMLVDASKQGFTFTNEDYQRLKKDVINIQPMKLRYKDGTLNGDSKLEHIIDRLVVLAHKTTARALKVLHETIHLPPQFDEDLVKKYKWAKAIGERNAEFKDLLDKLDENLK